MKKLILIFIISIFTCSAFSQKYSGENRQSWQEQLNEKYCSGLFKSAHGTIIDVMDRNVQSYFNILDWLEGRVAGLQVFVTWNGVRLPVIRGSLASVYVDEFRMDPSFLNSLPVNDIAMIKVIKTPFVGGIGNGAGGTIAIYTKQGDNYEDGEEISE